MKKRQKRIIPVPDLPKGAYEAYKARLAQEEAERRAALAPVSLPNQANQATAQLEDTQEG